MFDLISGGPRHPFHDKTAAPVVVSAIGHAVVVTLVLVIPVLYVNDALPKVPVMMAFVAEAPAPPPPPPPPPPPAARARGTEAKAVPAATTGRDAAPLEAPEEIRPEPARMEESLEGVEGGVEGGIAGGVAGGIVGGLITAPPPPPPPPPPPVPRGPVRIGGQLTAPALVHRVEPLYPPFAVAAKVSGVVILEATVAPDGSVSDVRVLRSVKFLDEAAIDAVRQWRYSPLVLNGIATPFVLTVTLSFRIPT